MVKESIKLSPFKLINQNGEIIKFPNKLKSRVIDEPVMAIDWMPTFAELTNSKLSANKTHKFRNSLMKNKKINYIKINIFPDGGISRFRIYGKKI